MQTICPECEAQIPLPDDLMRGELIKCIDCGVELELVDFANLKFEVAQPNIDDYGE